MFIDYLRNFLYKCFAHFSIGLSPFSLLMYRSCLYILYMGPLIDMHMANIFFHSLWLAFALLTQL